MKVTVKRNPGDGEILGILFILEDDAGVEYRGLRISPIPNTLDSMIYEMNETTFDPSISNFEDITKVSIAFLYNTKNGNKTSDIEDSYDGSFRNVVFDRVVTPTTTIEALSGNVDSIFNDPFFGNIAFVFIGEVPDYQDRYLQIDDETIKICYKIKAHSINIFPGIDNDENEIQLEDPSSPPDTLFLDTLVPPLSAGHTFKIFTHGTTSQTDCAQYIIDNP